MAVLFDRFLEAVHSGRDEAITNMRTRIELETMARYKRRLLEELHRQREDEKVIDTVINAMNKLDLETYENIVANNLLH